jgi:hypothetical protein
MVRSLVLFFAFVLFSLSAFAQQVTQSSSNTVHNHGLGSTQLIDGSVNPEKIPDLTAYRLWFLMAAVNPNVKPEDQAKEPLRSEAEIKKLGISDQDGKQVAAILNDFRIQYAAMVKSYNDNNALLRPQGLSPNLAAFTVKRDDLVQATRDKLNAALSFDGLSRLDTHVQNEKQHMRAIAPLSTTVATAGH